MVMKHLPSTRRYRVALALAFVLLGGPAATWSRAAPAASGTDRQPLFLPAVLRQRSVSFQTVGQFGGYMAAMATTGSAIYVGHGPRLAVFARAPDGMPRQVGESPPLAGIVSDVIVVGGDAFVGLLGGGVQWVDVRDATRPQLVATLMTGQIRAPLAWDGRHVFAADYEHLVAIDVSQYGELRIVGRLSLGPNIDNGLTALWPGPGWLWATYEGEPYLIDTRDVTQMRRVDQPLPLVNVLGVDGAMLYGQSGPDWALEIWEIRLDAAPRRLGRAATCGFGVSATLGGGRVFLLCHRYGVELQTVDVRDPARPQVESSVPITEPLTLALGWSGGHLYLASMAGLTVLDVRRPDRPRPAGQVATPTVVDRVASSGTTLFVADALGRLWVVDASDLTRPQIVDALTLPGPVGRLLIVGDRLYAGGQLAAGSTGGGGYVRVLALRDARSLVDRGGIEVPGSVFDMAMLGDTLFYVDAATGFRALDVSDAMAPRDITVSEPLGSFRQLAAQGSTVYAVGHNGLTLFDVADPARPAQIGFARVSYATSVAVMGPVAYVTGSLAVCDVRDGRRPAVVYYVPEAVHSASDLHIAGSLLFRLAIQLEAYDLTDIWRPVRVGQADIMWGVHDLALLGQDVAVASGHAGVWLLQTVDSAP